MIFFVVFENYEKDGKTFYINFYKSSTFMICQDFASNLIYKFKKNINFT